MEVWRKSYKGLSQQHYSDIEPKDVYDSYK